MILKSTKDGRGVVTDGKKINKVITLDLSEERDKEKFFSVDGITEITFNIVDSPINLFLDNPYDENKMTIVRPCSIGVETGRFFISNLPSKGMVEIWLWR